MIRAAQRQLAFTLVELLVAAAVTVVIVVFLGTMLGSLMNTSSRASQRTDAFRDARAALQIMQRDLSGLVKAQPAPYFEIDADLAGPDVRQLYSLVSAKNQPNNVALNAAGDVCAVRYYCAWDGRAYSLHRYFRNSDLTIKTFQQNLSSGPTLNYTDTGSLYYPKDGADEAIAAYAWNLQITAFDSTGTVINRTSNSKGRDTTGAPYICDPNGSTKPLPATIEISFRAISPVAARAVVAATSSRSDAYEVWKAGDATNPNPGDKQLYDNLIGPYAYDFRTRINLK